MTDHREFLTRAEVAELFRVPTGTLAQWAHRGYGPPYMIIGKRALYRRVDVDRWLAGEAQAQAR